MGTASRDYELILAVAEEKTLAIDGDFIWIKSTTGTIHVEINGGESALGTTQSKNFDRFEKITFKNKTGSPLQATFVAGFGGFADNNFSGTVTIAPGGTLQTAVDATVLPMSAPIVLLSASASRKKAILVASSANSSIVRIGDVNVGSARGIPLEPGQAIELDTSAEIRAFNPGSAAKTVHIAAIST